jgi:hypothetical protein
MSSRWDSHRAGTTRLLQAGLIKSPFVMIFAGTCAEAGALQYLRR